MTFWETFFWKANVLLQYVLLLVNHFKNIWIKRKTKRVTLHNSHISVAEYYTNNDKNCVLFLSFIFVMSVPAILNPISLSKFGLWFWIAMWKQASQKMIELYWKRVWMIFIFLNCNADFPVFQYHFEWMFKKSYLPLKHNHFAHNFFHLKLKWLTFREISSSIWTNNVHNRILKLLF